MDRSGGNWRMAPDVRGGAGGREERASARHRRRLRVALKGHPPFFTLDVGAGGFCVELLRALPPGTTVEGAIQVGQAEIPFAGRVAWAKSGDPRMNLRSRMGVAFLRIPAGFGELVHSR
jgi:hypothetical protein